MTLRRCILHVFVSCGTLSLMKVHTNQKVNSTGNKSIVLLLSPYFLSSLLMTVSLTLNISLINGNDGDSESHSERKSIQVKVTKLQL